MDAARDSKETRGKRENKGVKTQRNSIMFLERFHTGLQIVCVYICGVQTLPLSFALCCVASVCFFWGCETTPRPRLVPLHQLCIPLSPVYLRILFQAFMSLAAPLAHRRVVLVTGLFVLAMSRSSLWCSGGNGCYWAEGRGRMAWISLRRREETNWVEGRETGRLSYSKKMEEEI